MKVLRMGGWAALAAVAAALAANLTNFSRAYVGGGVSPALLGAAATAFGCGSLQ